MPYIISVINRIYKMAYNMLNNELGVIVYE
jgi:hypothetical protein